MLKVYERIVRNSHLSRRGRTSALVHDDIILINNSN